MSDNNAHPGVRSLLAKFENGQSPITSPPSRGRSPVCSDTPGSTRPLSRVRASFVTVDGVVQSNSGSPLRKTSGRSDSSSMFGPQINQEDVEARRQNVISPTPSGSLGDSQNAALGPVAAGAQAEEPSKVAAEPKATGSEQTVARWKEQAPAKTQESTINTPTPTVSQAASDKAEAKVVTKRPSNINGARNNATSKPASTASTTTKSSTDNTATKQLSARELAKERSNALAHKSSRASLNPAAKASARTTRGPTPSKELSGASPTNVSGTKPGTKSPTKPVRLPASATAPTQASSARLGPGSSSNSRASTTASTLTRKPSSLKSAGAGQTRTSTTATAGVRRQASRPSLPVQTTQERPSSRASDVGSTRPLNEGFLARMMRPTESSRSKTHDKPETKPAPKSTTVAKAPRLSTAKPATTQPKAKTAAPKAQNEKPQVAEVEPVQQKDDDKPVQPPQESTEKNDAASTVIPQEPVAEESIAEEPKTIAVNQAESEAPEVLAVIDNADEPVQSVESEMAATSSPKQVVDSTEPSEEKPVAEAPAENSVETITKTDADTSVESDEKTHEVPVETTEQTTEINADLTVKEDETATPHIDESTTNEQATTEQADEQTKEESVEATASAIEESPPSILEKEIPKPEPETPAIPEPSSVSEPAAETEEVAQVLEPPVEPIPTVNEETSESKDTAVPEPVETPTSEPPTDKKSENVDVDVAGLTLN